MPVNDEEKRLLLQNPDLALQAYQKMKTQRFHKTAPEDEFVTSKMNLEEDSYVAKTEERSETTVQNQQNIYSPMM